ncbi:MAG: hypothetical protein IPK15_26785 [Verrucomicrobia bacterium]|nr:hypothetical protein [Verrucomicrobiota bacterium]
MARTTQKSAGAPIAKPTESFINRAGVSENLAQVSCQREFNIFAARKTPSTGRKAEPAKVGPTGVANDLVWSDLQLQLSERIASWRHAGGGHGVRGVVNRIAEDAMREAEEGRGDMDAVWNQTGDQPGRFEDAPENIIVPVEFPRTAVCQMREGGRTAVNRFRKQFR